MIEIIKLIYSDTYHFVGFIAILVCFGMITPKAIIVNDTKNYYKVFPKENEKDGLENE
jgi:hypothetical protein